LALLSSASADYPAYGNGLIQKDTIKASVLTPDTDYTTEDAIAEAKEGIIDGAVEATEAPTATPDTLSGYITHTLLPKADKTIVMLDDQVEKARLTVANCGNAMEGWAPILQAGDTNLERQNNKLVMCLRVKNGETVKEEEFCEEWHSAAKDFNPKTLDNAKGNLKTYENILKVYYDFYPKFKKEEQKCREMIAMMHGQDKHCTIRVGEINQVYCGLKENRTNMCNTYDRCYAAAKAEYDRVKDKAGNLEEHTKKVVKALKCFKIHSSSLTFAEGIDRTVELDQPPKKSFKCDPSQWNDEMATYNLKVSLLPKKDTCSTDITNMPRNPPSWCSWQPATTATTTVGVASQGPSQGTYSLLQDSADLDTTSFSKVEEYLADAESVLKKVGVEMA